MRKLLVSFAIYAACVAQAPAVTILDSSIGAAWGYQWYDASNWGCKQHFIGESDLCLGTTAGCKTFEHKGINNDLSYGFILMVAHTVTEGGAYFCPTFVEGSKYGNTHTHYYDAGGTCHWLCKPGYSGTDCAQFSSAPVGELCDSNPVLPERYADLTVPKKGVPYIWTSLPYFIHGHWYRCDGPKHVKDEHDVVLAISRFKRTGHGAFARPMVFRGQWAASAGTLAVSPYPNTRDILLCKKGYKANADGTDCEIIDDTKCSVTEDDMLNTLCGGFQKDGYDSTQHQLELSEDGRCYVYKCREPGQAFTGTSDTTCIQCSNGLRGGASPLNGVCVSCMVGQIFDSTATSSNYCTDAVGLTNIEMMYGRGQTKNTVPQVKDQCWSKTVLDEYKDCIMKNPK